MRPRSWLNSESNAIYRWQNWTAGPQRWKPLNNKAKNFNDRGSKAGAGHSNFCHPCNNCDRGGKCNPTGYPTSITPLLPSPTPPHMLEESPELVEKSLKPTPYLPSHPPVANILQSFRILTEAMPGFLSSICLSTDKVYYNGEWRQTVPR